MLWYVVYPACWPVANCGQLWDLLEGKKLFPINFEKYDIQDEMKHLAHITGLLGPPPKEMLDCGRRTSMFYDSDGQFSHFSYARIGCTDNVDRFSQKPRACTHGIQFPYFHQQHTRRRETAVYRVCEMDDKMESRGTKHGERIA